MRSKFLLPLLLMLFTACARDPEINGNDPAQPRVEVEVASRISAEVTITSTTSEPGITYGAEIVRIVDGEESADKISFTAGELDDNQTCSWWTEDLQPNNTYVARTFITNGRNRKYSERKTFATPSTSKPTVSGVTLDGENLVASVLDNGGRSIEDVGFVAGDTPERKSLMRTEKIPAFEEENGRFSLPLNILAGGKTYYVIAYAIDDNEDVGYGGTPIEIMTPQGVESISLNVEELSLVPNESFTLTATIKPENAFEKNILWASSNENVVVVDSGKLTGIAEGTATITASAGGKKATCEVVVKNNIIAVTSITLNKTELSLAKGDSETLTATVLPSDATDKNVVWKSSDENIATITDGVISAIEVGTASIIASAGTVTDTCTVNVISNDIPVTRVALSELEKEVYISEQIRLSATVKPEDATDKSLTWESSNLDVATVSQEGVVTATGKGTCLITAKATSGQSASFSCSVISEAPEIIDPIFRDFIYTRFDFNHDEFLSREEVLKIQSINLLSTSYSDITSLSGIEYFENLSSLICNGCDIKELNLTNCHQLRELYCGSTSLTSLDVSNSPQLTLLNCYGCPITSLIISNCTKLKELYVSNTDITEIDLSDCRMLERLKCSKTKLTNLDLSNCTDLKELFCSESALQTLDLSSCPLIKDVYCGGNPISSLNLSGCSELEELGCGVTNLTSIDVTSCIALTFLGCESTKIAALDVSKCPQLRTLSVDRTNIEKIDLSNCSLLEDFSCQETPISELNLSNCALLKRLHCFGTNLQSLDVTSLPCLVYLDCGVTKIAELDVSNCKQLELLNCTWTSITDLDVSKCEKLRTLYCNSTHIDALDVTNCRQLQIFECNNTYIHNIDVSECEKLTSLRCSQTQIEQLDLRKNAELKYLRCISCKNLTDIWLINGHLYEELSYDSTATIHYD